MIRHDTFSISSCLLTSAYYAQRHRNLHINPKFHITGLEEKIFDCRRNYAAVKLINNTPTILLNHQICEVNRHKQNKRIALSFSKKIVHIGQRQRKTYSLLSIEQLIPVFSIIDGTDVIFESAGMKRIHRNYCFFVRIRMMEI
jgi:hypothetical protein